MAAWWFGSRAGLLVAFTCVCLYAIGGVLHPIPEFALALFIRAAFLFVVAVAVSLVAERLRVLEHSAEELEAIRAALAPAELPDLPGIDAAAAFVPSEIGVSGDFYLLTNGPDGSTVAIAGDVVGHGPKAARLATFIRARFAAFAASTSDSAELLTLTNAALADRPGREKELVSAACVRMRLGEPTVTWARAGHPPPLLLLELVELAADGSTFLLGAEEGLELHNTEAALVGSEGLVVYTDGATDVRQGRFGTIFCVLVLKASARMTQVARCTMALVYIDTRVLLTRVREGPKREACISPDPRGPVPFIPGLGDSLYTCRASALAPASSLERGH